MAKRFVVAITTDGSGDGTGYTPVFSGKISTVRYAKTDYADGVDFTITLEATGETVWTDTNINASETVAPRQATHGTDGAAAVYAAGGSAVMDKIVAAKDRVKIVVASGGDTKSGTFHIVVE